MSDRKQYIGDAVYVDWDGFHIVLTTEDGYRATNTIMLEPQVFEALERWVDREIRRRQNNVDD